MARGTGAIVVGDEANFRSVRRCADTDGDDPQFLHALLCQLGLPRRRSVERVFERRSGAASLLVEAGRWYTGLEWKPQPLPYGTRPRIVLINICSEAVRTRSRTVNVEDSVRGFLRRLGIDGGGYSMAGFKAQMIALACCRMELGYRTDRGVGQFDTRPISRFEAWLSEDDRQRGLWKDELDLSGPFFDSLIEHAVPLDAAALMSLQNSAMALDVYTWLAHRLHRVTSPSGTILSWRALKEQFGQEFAETREFRRSFLEALAKTTSVYPDARLDIVRGGLRLFPSPAPVRSSRVAVKLPKRKEAATGVTALAVTAASDVQFALEAIPLLPATLAKFEAMRTGRAIGDLWGMYRAMLGDKPPPHDVDQRFLSYVRALRPDRASAISRGPIIDQKTPALREQTREDVRGLAPGWDVDTLLGIFCEWNASRFVVVRDLDQAFTAWVPAYTKGRAP